MNRRRTNGHIPGRYLTGWRRAMPVAESYRKDSPSEKVMQALAQQAALDARIDQRSSLNDAERLKLLTDIVSFVGPQVAGENLANPTLKKHGAFDLGRLYHDASYREIVWEKGNEIRVLYQLIYQHVCRIRQERADATPPTKFLRPSL